VIVTKDPSPIVPRRALISVTNKDGVVDFARGLSELGVEIVSTGGTRALLAKEGVLAREVAELTGWPEMLDGRVKTLHPKVHGGILARRDVESHRAALEDHEIPTIDLVIVNLYAFDRAAAKEGATIEEVIEEIDIGGPALLRAAAKNHAHVIPLVDPEDYPRVLDALRKDGDLDLDARRALALKVYQHTARYDRSIAEWLEPKVSTPPQPEALPAVLIPRLERAQALRYGENPHQRAALYRDGSSPPASLVGAQQLSGKELSFNNLLDADAALALAMDLGGTTAVFVKHNNPCGVARAATLADAVRIARECDPVSAFGAVIALTSEVDRAAAEVLGETFIEVVVAPSFGPEAIEILGKKKNLRLLATGPFGAPAARGLELRRIRGGWLAQESDVHPSLQDEVNEAKLATKRGPRDDERRALAFAWIVAKHVRSNAIVFARPDRIVAVGAGQMSRVDSVAICKLKAGEALKGTVVASDAFFPFRDGVDLLADAGATAIVQPGGSVRDPEVIAAADEHEVAMLLTGVRHFRH
jgi:phosphoribosylaminoimidazolecarboxamide formyltransferase / IMP cyclohydrolase